MRQRDDFPGTIGRIIVIGAGPAGSAAAIRAREHGMQVLLVERAVFPRSKVCGCCLNAAALSSLDEIGCRELVEGLGGRALQRWRLTLPGRVVEADLPGGFALSRSRLDTALADEAARRGVEVRTACEARILAVADDAVRVSLRSRDGNESQLRFDAAIAAGGLTGGGLQQWLPWTREPSGPFGASTIVDHLPEVQDGTIHMMCGPGGYVGLVRLEDGRVDIAAALHRGLASGSDSGGRAAVLDRMNTILHACSFPLLDPGKAIALQTTPPLRRTRLSGGRRLLAVGDAVGYVEPFTGEGMAWAIRTGIDAADCLAEADSPAEAWRRRYQRLSRRKYLCRTVAFAVAGPNRLRLTGGLMAAAPWLVRSTVKLLNRK